MEIRIFAALIPLAALGISLTTAPRPASTTTTKSYVAIQDTAMKADQPPTFYRDILPILQQHCQRCHRAGQIAPFPLMCYSDARQRAARIATVVSERIMPPWFADPQFGHFSNDPSLSPQEIATLVAWAKSNGPAGDENDAPQPRKWTAGWNIPAPDRIIEMPQPVSLPASGDVEYTYEIVPTKFSQDQWVQMSEIRPTSRENVHHAVVIFVRRIQSGCAVRPSGFPSPLQISLTKIPVTARTGPTRIFCWCTRREVCRTNGLPEWRSSYQLDLI
jgi:mono/diheme cytochrome c family protein